jgi:hypothetical protein
MLIIQNPSQLHHITDPDIRKLLTLRLSQLGSTLTAPMIIMEPGDSLSDIEKEIGFSILTVSAQRHHLKIFHMHWYPSFF